MACVSLQNIVLKRSGKPVLNLNWHIEDGSKQVALIGRNGVGKSSLCRLLNGLLVPDSGLVLINGQQPRTRCINTLRQVGYMFQNPEHQMICPTVREEIAFGPAQLGNSKAAADSAARELLDQHQLNHWADWPVAELSYGQQKLLCLLSVLVNKPALLVLDEPFAGLDLYTVRYFQNFLAQLSQLQIVISHQLSAIREFDRVCWLRDGRVVADGDAGAVIAAYEQESLLSGAALC